MNVTAGGSAEHISLLVSLGVIRPLCDLLTVKEPKVNLVILDALSNILIVSTCMKYMSGQYQLLKVLTFWKFTYKWSGWISGSYCSLCSGMGQVVLARTSLTLYPPFPPTVL